MQHHDLIVRSAFLVDPAQGINAVRDIAIDGEQVSAVGDLSNATADEEIDATGLYASPGWIDLHAHVLDGANDSGGVDPDSRAGIHTGVTTVVDAGTAGADTWNALQEYVIDRSATRVLAYLNVSLRTVQGPRHGQWDNFDQVKTVTAARREIEAGHCVGIKVLASQRHCGNMDIVPVKLARQAARHAGTHMMVHMGVAPPVIQDVLSQMDSGDILTHCWKGTLGNLLGPDNTPIPEAWDAVERGVRFDIGHGQSSFSFETARYAMDAGLPLHAISTDLHRGNAQGPVYDQATTMAKFLHLGLDLNEVIRLSTISPAELIDREESLGSLHPGKCADVTMFRVIEGEFELTDASNRTERAERKFQVEHTIRGGRPVRTAEEVLQ